MAVKVKKDRKIEKRDTYGIRFLTAFSLSLCLIMGLKISYDHCLCCGSASISKVLDCKDFTVSQEFFEIWECRTCTFRFTQNIPDEGDIGAYYQSASYISHTNTKQGIINRLYHFVRSFTLRFKRDLIKKVTGLQRGTLLDIGAGTGAFAFTMQQSGWNVTGLEPDETARAKAFENYTINLWELSKLTNLQKETFDAITLWHVFEHVHDLHGYLKKFLEILKPTGRLVIAVPNYTSFDAKKYKEYWASYDVPRHLYHFSPHSLQVLLQKTGFALESVKPMWFDSFYVSMLSEKNRLKKNWFASAIWVGLVSNISAFFKTKKCSSVIYIIRKAL